MKELRLLFTGVGRRIELIQSFREAALCLGVSLKIYGADIAMTASALAYCDYSRNVCDMKDENYILELVSICRKDKIDILIPTIDTDLLVLSQNVSLFGETKVLISSPEKITICRDKNFTADFFESCGCHAPKTVNDWRKYNGQYPCFIKPKDGSGSINALKAESSHELEIYAKHIKDYIIQPFIDGTEYTVDIFCDFDGNPIYITPRIRLQVRIGEVLKTQITMDENIVEECKRIVAKFRPVGPLTIQLIKQNLTGDNYYIEINPRFGGGAPLSMKSGARSAEAILKLLMNEKLEESNFISDGAIYSRFDQNVCVQNGASQPLKGIIFDLDDTLYNEKQYIRSGYRAVEKYLGIPGAAEEMWRFFENNEPAIDSYLAKIDQLARKIECLKIYREHMPEISLREDVVQHIQDLKCRGIKIGIITDGRPTGQWNKIRALGLEEMVDDIIVTDELGGEQFRKPCDIAFRIMQRRWRIPFEQIMYVGDNIHKDFQAPKQLGMQWMLVENKDSLYQADVM